MSNLDDIKFIRHYDEHNEMTPLLRFHPEAKEEIKALFLELIGEDEEQNFYREDGEDGRWMCSTCNGEVFGGICECSAINERLDELRQKVDEL